MKTWLIILLQTLLLGGFLYFMFTPDQQSLNQDFLKDSGEIITMTHQPHPEPSTTNQPSTETPDERPVGTGPNTPNRPEDSGPTSPNPDQPDSSETPAEGTPTSTPTPEETPVPTETPPTSELPTQGPDQPADPQIPSEETPSTNPSETPPAPENPETPTEGTGPSPTTPDETSPEIPVEGNPTSPTTPEEIPSVPTETGTPPTSEPSTQGPDQSADPHTPSEETPSTNPNETPTTSENPEGPTEGTSPSSPGAGNTSVEGSADQVKIIFKSQSRQNSCRQIRQRPVTLCDLNLKNNCKRWHVSEELPSFWMISPIYTANTDQTKHLYELHINFRNYVKSYGINFQTVEVVFPGQEFQLTQPNNQPYDLQYHSDWIFAMRENLVNVGVKHLPDDWQYMAWIDQHIFWLDPYWFEKTILAFAHWNIVHMLNGNDFWTLKNTTDYHLDGFARIYREVGMGFVYHDPRQCGLAWGMRRDIFERVGGLLDICIGTKCDLYQNYAYAGSRYTSQTGNGEYAEMIGRWQDNAIKVYDKQLGFVDTKVIHFMHCYDGCKTSDYNLQIWALIRHDFNPNKHIERDEEGRMSLVNNLPLAQELWTLYGGAPRDK